MKVAACLFALLLALPVTGRSQTKLDPVKGRIDALLETYEGSASTAMGVAPTTSTNLLDESFSTFQAIRANLVLCA